nr:hypothetical protein [Bacteroidota bacterium]
MGIQPKYFLILFLSSMVALNISGQVLINNDTLPEPATEHTESITEEFIEKPGLLSVNPDKKVSLRLEMGTSFGVGSGQGNLFGVYVSPNISYRINPKFRINFGATIRNSNFVNYYSPYSMESTARFSDNFTQTFVYVEGEYMLNPRLMLTAKAYKEVYTFNEPSVNPRALNMDNGGVAVGFNYKVNENTRIGAEFSFNKGRSPYQPYFPGSVFGSGYNPFGTKHSDPFNP